GHGEGARSELEPLASRGRRERHVAGARAGAEQGGAGGGGAKGFHEHGYRTAARGQRAPNQPLFAWAGRLTTRRGRSTRDMSCSSSRGSKGLPRYPWAPISSASHSYPKLESTTTGTSAVSACWRRCCKSARPFITGICRSRSTSRGGRAVALS